VNIQKTHAEAEARDRIMREMMGQTNTRMGVYGRVFVTRVWESDRSSDILMLETSGRYRLVRSIVYSRISVRFNIFTTIYCYSLVRWMALAAALIIVYSVTLTDLRS